MERLKGSLCLAVGIFLRIRLSQTLFGEGVWKGRNGVDEQHVLHANYKLSRVMLGNGWVVGTPRPAAESLYADLF